jgi:hypothetical protein
MFTSATTKAVDCSDCPSEGAPVGAGGGPGGGPAIGSDAGAGAVVLTGAWSLLSRSGIDRSLHSSRQSVVWRVVNMTKKLVEI